MDWIVGDIHGCYYSLLELLKKIEEENNATPDATPVQLIFLGDYMDRGPYSKQVVEHLLKLQSEGAICLRGNHDDVIDWIVNHHCISDLTELCKSLDDFHVVGWWLQQGFYRTLISYGINTCWNVDNVATDIRNIMPDSHKQFLRNLPLYWSNDTHFACHASFGTDKNEPREAKFFKNEWNNDTLWTRFKWDIKGVTTKWDKIGVFGHTPVWYHGSSQNDPEAIFHDKIRIIDLGCFSGGRLAAYCCQQDRYISVRRNKQDEVFTPC